MYSRITGWISIAVACTAAATACVPGESGAGTGTGGAATGGATSGSGGGTGSGGAATPASGGAVGSGGINASGGATSGGASGTGGSTASGGRAGGATGGTTGSGGALATGGSSTTGGSSGAGGTSTGHGGGTGSASGGMGGANVPGTPSGEDDGADCVVTGLPDAASLSANAKFPDPFKKLDGSRVTTKADWRCRREELRKLAEKFAYGTKPPKAATVTGTVSSSGITVKVTDNGKSTTFSAQIVLPGGGSAPYPAIIVLGGASFGAPLDSGVIKSEGVALINYDQYVVGKEGTGRANKQGAFYDLYGSTSTTGLLMAWSWGVSRIIDVIEQSGGSVIKTDAIGVTGCSRLGKGAFTAGVFDQRVALTMPIEAGTGGQASWRGIATYGGQSLTSAYNEQPWFGDAFMPFINGPTKAPLDTHALVAMVAPRGLFVMDNPHTASLGAKPSHAAVLAGAEVYKALGAAANVTYVSDVASSAHCSQRPEWVEPLRNNIQKFLKKTGSAPGVIKASSKATSSLAEWSDWTTPTLN